MAKLVSKVYGDALFEAARDCGKMDASLIGGMVIRIGDRVVDTSIKTKLYELSKSLKKIQV